MIRAAALLLMAMTAGCAQNPPAAPTPAAAAPAAAALANPRATAIAAMLPKVPIGTPALRWTLKYLRELRPTLARSPGGRDRFRLLLSFSGRPLERVAVWQIVRRNALAAGLRGVHPHALRHSFAPHLSPLTGS